MSRRRMVMTLAVGVMVLALAHDISAQGNPYQMIDNFFKMPDGRKVGSTAGITIDRDGTSIWVFERCGGNYCTESNVDPILKFDASGTVVKRFGAGMFVRPHGIHIDRDGNVWVSDGEGPDGKDPKKNGKGHQVFKFSPDGKLLLTLGKAGVAGNGPDTFNMPSAILVAPNGDIFIGDGHGGDSNARMVKFDKNGKFIKTWGKKGTAPGDFETPHTLAMDSRGRLFVGDRGNNRVQIFDQDGRYLEEWKQFGRPSGIFIDRNDILYVTDHQSDAKTNPGFTKGIRIGSVRDGKVTAFIPDTPDGSQEGVAADARGNIYGSLTGGMALRKYVRAAPAATQSETRISGEGFISEGIPKMPNPPGPAPKRDLSGAWVGPGTSNKPDPAPPLTAAGEAVFKQRKAYTEATNLGGRDETAPGASNDPFITCDPLGFPRNVITYGITNRGGVLFGSAPNRMLIAYEQQRAWREIWLDGRALPKAVDVRGAPESRWYGFSVGRWENDTTFVIDSTGFDERPWLDAAGHPRSSMARIQERYRRLDQYNVEVTLTIDDPKYYTKPWTFMRANLYWMKAQEFAETLCVPSEAIRYRDALAKPSGIDIVP